MAETPVLGASNEVDDLVANLFGDFSDSEGGASAADAGQTPAAEAPKRPAEEASGEERRPKKRRKTGDASRFFDLEAVEAGDGEEEEEDDMEDLIDDAAAPQDQSRQRAELNEVQAEMDRRDATGTGVRGSGFLDRLEEKYRGQDGKDDGVAVADIGRSVPSAESRKAKTSHQTTFIVPDTARDPRLWCCKTFAPERELCLSLLIKAGFTLSANKPCPVFSAFYNPSLRGYIYIEAHKENDIREFARGIRGISPWAIRLVPVAQMAQVFTSAHSDAGKKEIVKVGEWVRMKKNLYKGDLAQIEEIQDNEFTVRIKPRLDYSGQTAKKALPLGATGAERKNDREAKKRPAARWFNRADVEAAGLVISSARERRFTSKGFLSFFMVEDEVYRDGFMYKKYKDHFFITGEAVRPSEHELQDWASAPAPSAMTTPDVDLVKQKPEDEERDRKLMPPPSLVPTKAISQQKMALELGDIVIVTHGDLLNMRGVVIKASIAGNTVQVRPHRTEGVRENSLTISVDRLSKYFETGDHIKAQAGESAGNSGYIVKVDLNEKGPKWAYGASVTCVSIDGLQANEWKVLINHAQLSVEQAATVAGVGEYKVSDIVMYGEMVCIVTRLEANEKVILLDYYGRSHMTSYAELVPIANSGDKGAGKSRGLRNFWTGDRKGNRITVGCNVTASHRTLASGVKAEVIWIFKNYVFLRAMEMLVGEKAYMVVSGTACEYQYTSKEAESVVAEIAKKKKEREEEKRLELEAAETGGEAVDAALNTNIQKASDVDFLPSWFKKTVGIKEVEDPRPFDKGETVRIIKGAYKGLRAEVRDYVGEKIRLSLLAKPKLVMVERINCQFDDYSLRGEKRWLLAKDAKVVKQDNAGEDYAVAPATPQAPDVALIVPQSPTSDSEDGRAIQAIASGTSAKADLFAAQDFSEWDPQFLMKVDEPEAAEPSGDTQVAPTEKAGNSWAKLLDGEDELGEQASEAGGAPEEMEEEEDMEDDESWLMLGIGITYREGSAEQQGWVFKVSPDDDLGGSVLVVPNEECPRAGTVPLSAMKRLKEKQLKPFGVFVKGDMVAVIRGEQRDKRGKVLTSMTLEALKSGTMPIQIECEGETLEVQKKDLVLFDKKWENAAIEGIMPEEDTEVEMMDEAPVRPSAGIVGSSRPTMTDLAAPIDVPDATPQAMVVDTPTQMSETTMSETPMSDVTMSETPTTDAGSSMYGETPGISPPVAPLRVLRRASRLPVPGGVSPSPSGAASPAPSGGATPMPGGVTPMLPGVNTPVPGGVTPLGAGAETPGATPGSSSGGGTPMPAQAVPGMLTPMPGAATPDNKLSGNVTPALSQVAKSDKDIYEDEEDL